ncbi:hypothetical protein [Pasteurella canis]|uniref:hypothetical protein n=1 Tax=Pasteurella canis TaxID=753 RepID=UPI00132C98EF|nr:hypothetical protein [Pasteurella canis]MXN89189.1 hypothetical protein [Pasteurella canis]
MKKSIFKTSLLVTLSTLFVACGSHNHTSVNKETQKQPQQSQKPAPQTKPQANSQDKAPQEKPNNTEQSSSSSMQTENSTQNHSTEAEAEKEQKPSKPEQPMNTENSADKKDEMRNTDTSKHNSSENMQSDMPDSMADNHKPKENSPQMPPKTENPANSNNMSSEDKGKEKDKEKENQSISKPKLELPQGDMPSSPPLPPGLLELGDWEGKTCHFDGHCRNVAQSPENIPNSSITPTDKISLQLGENKGDNYQFNLLGESEEKSLYYGYRSYSISYLDEDKKVHDLIQATNTNQINKETIPNHFNAQYKKDNGFLYISFASLSRISADKNTPQYADINITYEDGKVTGKVTKTGEANITLFDIKETENHSTSGYTLTVTPTKQETKIPTKESVQFDVYFLDSKKNQETRKYITGVGSGKKWGGVFAAEKQTENKPSSSTSTKAE